MVVDVLIVKLVVSRVTYTAIILDTIRKRGRRKKLEIRLVSEDGIIQEEEHNLPG